MLPRRVCSNKKKAQKIVSHPRIEPETSRTRSKCVSIVLCKEFEQEVVLIDKIGSVSINLIERVMNKCDFSF